MTVQELFKQANSEIVFHAYTLIDSVFDDLDNHSIEEKATVLKHFRVYIDGVCEQIATTSIEKTDKKMTLFVLGRTRTTYGESYMQDLECFAINDEDAMKVVHKNFTMWSDDGDARLEHYGMDFVTVPIIAGYKIAKSSVEEYGVDVCCAAILVELFEWGYTEEQREEKRLELDALIQEIEEDTSLDETVSSEELWEELDKDFAKNATEDEKEHRRLRREYKKSVEEIERRYMIDIVDKDHKRFIEVVRNEYKNRKVE